MEPFYVLLDGPADVQIIQLIEERLELSSSAEKPLSFLLTPCSLRFG
jgi:hypothetical protein